MSKLLTNHGEFVLTEKLFVPGAYYRCVNPVTCFTVGQIYRAGSAGHLRDNDGDWRAHLPNLGYFEPCDEVGQPEVPLDQSKEGPEDPGTVDDRPHYYARLKIEPITFCIENNLEFWRGNPIKYICRAGHKVYVGSSAEESEKADLRKAIRMLEMRINYLDGKDVL